MTKETTKQERVLAMAASHGVPPGLYPLIVAELVKAGRIEQRVCVSKAGGYRTYRHFLTQTGAA